MNIRNIAYKYPDSVMLQVSGPKNLLSGKKIGHGRTNMTWIHFLNSVCQVKLDLSDNYYISTVDYKPGTDGPGWTARINDPIKKFIDRFSQTQGIYCVRINTGVCDKKIQDDTCTTTTPLLDDSNNTINWLPTVLRKSTSMYTVPVRKYASVVPPTPVQLGIAGKAGAPTTSSRDQSTRQRTSDQPKSQTEPKLSLQRRLSLAVSKVRAQNQAKLSGAASNTSATNRPGPGQRKTVSPKKKSRLGSSSTSKLYRESLPSTRQQTQPGTSKRHTLPKLPPPRKNYKDNVSKLVKRDGELLRVEPQEAMQMDNDEIIEIDLTEETDEDIRRTLGIEDDDNDRQRLLTSPSSEDEQNLYMSGVPITVIKSILNSKLDKLDKTMARGILKEIRKMEHTRAWERNLRRSPLSFSFLMEIFKYCEL